MKAEKCPVCNGQGELTELNCIGQYSGLVATKCWRCHGSGKVYHSLEVYTEPSKEQIWEMERRRW